MIFFTFQVSQKVSIRKSLSIEQRILDADAGKQQSKAATDVLLRLVLKK